jgi:TolA-binding protein
MLLCDFLTKPLITDWIQALGVIIGIPLVIRTYRSLKKENVEIKGTVNSLGQISKSNNEIVGRLEDQTSELFKQSSEFQFQSYQMELQTKIMERQLAFLIEKHKNENDIKNHELNISLMTRKNEIKPYFVHQSSGSSLGSFDIKLLNKGAIAKNISIGLISNEKVKLITNLAEVDSKGILKITGGTSENANLLNVDFTVLFTDKDGNKYSQSITRIGHRQIIINNPIEVE